MMDLEDFGKVKLIERNRWVLSRQLDGDAGGMVVDQVRELGLDVLLSKRVGRINTDDSNNVTGVTFEDGEKMDCSCICFAVSLLSCSHEILAYLLADRYKGPRRASSKG